MLLLERGDHGHQRFDKARTFCALRSEAAFVLEDIRPNGTVELSEGSLPSLVFRTLHTPFAAHGSSINQTLVMRTLDKHPPVSLVRVPVALDDPVARFAVVSAACPLRQFQVQRVV
jgi:hypothetical protein